MWKIIEKLQNIFQQDEVYRMNRADAEKTLANVLASANKKNNEEGAGPASLEIPMQDLTADPASLRVLGNHADGDTIYLALSDADVDVDKTYAQTADGLKWYPKRLDTEKNELLLPFPDPPQETDVYIFGTAGEELHMLLTPQAK